MYFAAKLVYHTFYAMSYKVESQLSKTSKLASLVALFGSAISLCLIMMDHRDPKQSELGFLLIFVLGLLFLLNSVLTLNPLQREASAPQNRRSCCKGSSLLLTISVVVILMVMELHYLTKASPD